MRKSLILATVLSISTFANSCNDVFSSMLNGDNLESKIVNIKTDGDKLFVNQIYGKAICNKKICTSDKQPNPLEKLRPFTIPCQLI